MGSGISFIKRNNSKKSKVSVGDIKRMKSKRLESFKLQPLNSYKHIDQYMAEQMLLEACIRVKLNCENRRNESNEREVQTQNLTPKSPIMCTPCTKVEYAVEIIEESDEDVATYNPCIQNYR